MLLQPQYQTKQPKYRKGFLVPCQSKMKPHNTPIILI